MSTRVRMEIFAFHAPKTLGGRGKKPIAPLFFVASKRKEHLNLLRNHQLYFLIEACPGAQKYH